MATISIISDFHFGYGTNTEREEDPFIAAREAFEKAKNSDLIILPGDIFDSKIPKPEVWAKSMKILNRGKNQRHGKNCEILKLKGKDMEDISEQNTVGIPMVAIHGTHERRGEGLINPVEGLEHAGFLIHLHCQSILLKVDGNRIGIHGMSGVPEKYAKEVLMEWNPEPFENAYNIFMLHQSIEPYIYSPNNPPSLKLEDLPDGFDLYVSGHIHWKDKTEVNGKPFIIPGSTITTQIKKLESKYSKGFWKIEDQKNIGFVELETPRKSYNRSIELKGEGLSEIEDLIGKELKDIMKEKHEKKPLIRINIEGKMAKGLTKSDLDVKKMKKPFKDKGIITIGKKLQRSRKEKNVEELRDIRDEKISVDELGMKILRENLEGNNSNFNYDDVLQSLVDGDLETVLNTLLSKEIKENKKTIKEDSNLDRWLKN
ncbi:MAG: DNA repair exonuclease [Candidatus Aenigmatarchaeota archaeon]